MNLSEFKIGSNFFMSGKTWRCTDIGTRIITAICLTDVQITYDTDWENWLYGPPYAVPEYVIDEDDMPTCQIP